MKTVTKKKLGSKIKKAKKKKPLPCLWKGPAEDGVTQSMLASYLNCKERFRLKVVEGLKVNEGFSHALEYGNMWHECEEALADNRSWTKALEKYAARLGQTYPEARYDIQKWYNVCRVQFPRYVSHWENHSDVKARTPLYQEVTFKVPYKLPSGRTILMRGKWDAVDIIGKGKNAGIYLQENKSKGRVNEQQLLTELPFDLQSNYYLIALIEHLKTIPKSIKNLEVKGVRYNVIRRPFGDRKNSIVQKKGREVNKKDENGKTVKDTNGNPVKIRVGIESDAEFYERLGNLIEEECNYFFMRWKIEFFPSDLEKFKEQTLHPLLENLCDDYEWWNYCNQYNVSQYNYQARGDAFPEHVQRHHRKPFGIWDPLLEGRQDDYIEYLTTGSTVGLRRVETLFPELKED